MSFWEFLALCLYDYGTPILIAVFVFCVIVLVIWYRKKIISYPIALINTIKLIRNTPKADRKINRYTKRINRLRKKRDKLLSDRLEYHLKQMFDNDR